MITNYLQEEFLRYQELTKNYKPKDLYIHLSAGICNNSIYIEDLVNNETVAVWDYKLSNEKIEDFILRLPFADNINVIANDILEYYEIISKRSINEFRQSLQYLKSGKHKDEEGTTKRLYKVVGEFKVNI